MFRGTTQWYFTGRHAALKVINEWLTQPSSGGSMVVVTGDPGSGKSALLGFLVTASDASEVADESLRALLETMPTFARPPVGIVVFALHLKGKPFTICGLPSRTVSIHSPAMFLTCSPQGIGRPFSC